MSTATAVKERPILFSAEMVKAILDGRKVQTRRIIKDRYEFIVEDDGAGGPPWPHYPCYVTGEPHPLPLSCPYGKVGYRLWVRETTWYRDEDGVTAYADGSLLTHPSALYGNKLVQADEPPKDDWPANYRQFGFRVVPSVHMPRRASRITLEITGVKVGRLQDISEEDIDAEGITEHLVKEILSPVAKRFNAVPEHWVHGGDEGLSYCYKCCEKEVAKLLKTNPSGAYCVDGGWGSEGDSQAFCETCSRALDNSYTRHCCESEIEHFEDCGFDPTSVSDCHSLSEVLSANGFCGELGPRVKRLCWQALWKSINGTESWDANPWVWVVSFRRLA